MSRVMIYKRFERFWHWCQALLIFTLLFTGFEIHGSYSVLGFGDATQVHTLAAWALIGCYAVAMLRAESGLGWIVWLVLVVVVSDVAGYFAGRILGGPKFWPKVSPKKTWSGTIAGWAGAAVVGAVMAVPLGAGAGLIVISVLVSFAGQMGDIAESAVKRHVGVKDSSDLIPGHGGVLDRFDAMLGAGVLVFVLVQLGLMPGVA